MCEYIMTRKLLATTWLAFDTSLVVPCIAKNCPYAAGGGNRGTGILLLLLMVDSEDVSKYYII